MNVELYSIVFIVCFIGIFLIYFLFHVICNNKNSEQHVYNNHKRMKSFMEKYQNYIDNKSDSSKN